VRIILITIMAVVLLLTGCDRGVKRDRASLANLSLGMTKAEVYQVMGHEPSKNEALLKNGMQFEILFYVTETHSHHVSTGERHMTPIVLQDGKVVGWGNSAYDRKTRQVIQ
jgi:hypothetical protein